MKHTIIHTCQFAEWIAERYNFIGGEYCCWCAKQYDQSDTSRYQLTSELFAYWKESIDTQQGQSTDMENFTADQAREISTRRSSTEYDETINRIRAKAQFGVRALYLYNSPLSEATIEKLRENGFSVFNAPSISIQKDGLYHSISW